MGDLRTVWSCAAPGAACRPRERSLTEQEKRELRGRVFRDVDLAGVDFSGADLRSASFTRVDLRDCDFSRADLGEASFIECDVRRACFAGARLTRNRFAGSWLTGASGLHVQARRLIVRKGGAFLRVMRGDR